MLHVVCNAQQCLGFKCPAIIQNGLDKYSLKNSRGNPAVKTHEVDSMEFYYFLKRQSGHLCEPGQRWIQIQNLQSSKVKKNFHKPLCHLKGSALPKNVPFLRLIFQMPKKSQIWGLKKKSTFDYRQLFKNSFSRYWTTPQRKANTWNKSNKTNKRGKRRFSSYGNEKIYFASVHRWGR